MRAGSWLIMNETRINYHWLALKFMGNFVPRDLSNCKLHLIPLTRYISINAFILLSVSLRDKHGAAIHNSN